jgi:hypothetical protein
MSVHSVLLVAACHAVLWAWAKPRPWRRGWAKAAANAVADGAAVSA